MEKVRSFIAFERAVCQPSEFSKLLRAMDGYQGNRVLTAALKLAPLVFVRSEELRHAEWKQVDWDASEWSFVMAKARNRKHIVPLASQAVRVLRDLHELTGKGRYVFPRQGRAEIPIGPNAFSAALQRVAYSGGRLRSYLFRAAARSILVEVLNEPPAIVGLQLGHAVTDPDGIPYNLTAFLADRHEMIQNWADYLDGLRVEIMR